MNIKRILYLLLAVVAFALLAFWYFSSQQNNNQNPVNTNPIATTTKSTTATNTQASPTKPNLFQADNVLNANNQFAVDLYLRYASQKNSDENIFFSPFSISSAMAMVYEGAKGQTAQEIGNVFHFPADIAQVRNGYQNAFANINNNSSSYTLSTANALWVQNNYQLLSDYTNAVKTYYGGNVTNLDFINNPLNAVSTINQWVANKTNNKIQNILSAGSIDKYTRLILTNAIYFKGAWNSKFEKSATRQKTFTTNNGNSQVPMMEQTLTSGYTDTGNAQMLELPYNQHGISMFILLPKDNNLPAFSSSLTYKEISAWEKKLQNNLALVDVSLPKFKIETEEHMPSDLGAMGMPTAFSQTKADFSGIALIKDPSQNLYISDVIHKAFIDTDENGTEAAAATAVVVGVGAAMEVNKPQPIIFNANHPFIFFIQENMTGNILFIGRVANP